MLPLFTTNQFGTYTVFGNEDKITFTVNNRKVNAKTFCKKVMDVIFSLENEEMSRLQELYLIADKESTILKNKIEMEKRQKRLEEAAIKEEKIKLAIEQNRHIWSEIDKIKSSEWANEYENIRYAKDVMPSPTMEDFFICTDAWFTSLESLVDGQTDIEFWENLKESGLDHVLSPKSESQYLLDHKRQLVWRYSTHWGKCASCYWGVKDGVRGVRIGVCHISEFERNMDLVYHPKRSERRNELYKKIAELEKQLIPYE
jgi:hypothetical protein